MNFHLLKNIDLFGAEVGIRYEGQNKYTTKVGGLATLVVGSLLFALIYQQVMQIKNKEDPNVIFQQTHVDNPSKYELSPDKFSIMFGLHDLVGPIIDEQIYTIEASFDQKVKKQNQNGTSSYVITSLPLNIKVCTAEDFQMVEVQDYFKNMPFQSYYCIKNQTNVYLQGQFEKEFYSSVKFKIKECVNKDTCKDPLVRQAFLKTSKFQIYFTNRIMDMQNHEKPFKAVGQTTFYHMFYDYYVITNLIFTNTFVVDDDGLFMQNQKIQKELLFTTDKYYLQTKSSDYLLQCVLYLQKDKEDTYNRNYPKIQQVLSQLGGTFQVLFIIGCFLIKPYNQFQLQNRLYEDIFSIEHHQTPSNISSTQKQDSTNLSQTYTIKKQKENIQSKPSLKQDITFDKSNEQPKQNNQQNCFSRFLNEYIFQSIKNVHSQKGYIESLRSLKQIIILQIKFRNLQTVYNESQIIMNNQTNFQQTKQSKINNNMVSQQFQENTDNQFYPNDKECSQKVPRKAKSLNSTFIQSEDAKDSLKNKKKQLKLEVIINKQNSEQLKSSRNLINQNKNNQEFNSPQNEQQYQQCSSPINQSIFLSKHLLSINKQEEFEPNINIIDLESSEPQIPYKQESYTQQFQSLKSLTFKSNMKHHKKKQQL